LGHVRRPVAHRLAATLRDVSVGIRNPGIQ
jgi:hypothetical protein